MVSTTHTMNFCISKNKICRILWTSFAPKQNITCLIFYYSEKTCTNIFNQTIDNTKKVNKNYVTT